MEETTKHNIGTGSTDRRDFLKTSAVAGTVLALLLAHHVQGQRHLAIDLVLVLPEQQRHERSDADPDRDQVVREQPQDPLHGGLDC